MTSNFILLEIPWTGSLYEPSSDLFLEKLEIRVNNVKAGDVVVLRVCADCHDYSLSWLTYLKDQAVWHELAKRLERWHAVLFRIIASRARWFFLADGDVVGSWWEFACAFHGRILTNPYAKVGFPEVYIDLFPPLGLLGLKRIKAYEAPNITRKNAIIHAKDAYKLGAIDLCLISDDWTSKFGIEHLKAWFEKHPPAPEIKASSVAAYLKAIPSEEDIEHARSEPRTRISWLERARLDEAFEASKEKNLAQRTRKLAEIRAAAASRFLMADYIAWLSRRVTRYRLGIHDRWWVIASDLIAIDLTHGLPPQSIVNTFLLRRKRIVFIASEPEKLRVGLEAIKSKFNRRDSEGQDAFNFWNTSVSWVCTPTTEQFRGITFEFHWDDSVFLRCGSSNLKYYRISGNHSRAAKGWYEEISADPAAADAQSSEAEEMFETVALIANGILTSTRKVMVERRGVLVQLPLTVTLRLLLLEYLLQLADRMPRSKSLLDLLKMLSQAGWGYASDPYQWEALLKACVGIDKHFGGIFDDFFQPGKPLKLHDLTHVLDHKSTPELASQQLLDLRSGGAVSRYLEVFSFKVTSWLLAKKYVASLDEADLFVTMAWGYPGMLAPPHSLKVGLGEARLAYWQDHSLNTLVDDGPAEP